MNKHQPGPADDNLEHRICQLCQAPWPCSGAPAPPEYCEDCGGRGDVIVSDYLAPDTPGMSPAKCPRCLGTGVQP